jgi:hypothetical protein
VSNLNFILTYTKSSYGIVTVDAKEGTKTHKAIASIGLTKHGDPFVEILSPIPMSVAQQIVEDREIWSNL